MYIPVLIKQETCRFFGCDPGNTRFKIDEKITDLCQGYLFIQLLYTWNVLCGYGILKKEDLQNGILTYRRNKTGQLLFVKWEKPMQELIDKYDTFDTPYLLSVIRNNGVDEWHQYQNAAHRINRNLKQIGKQIGLDIPLTTYVARHAWASIAQSKILLYLSSVRHWDMIRN